MFLVGEWAVGTDLISVMKFRSIDNRGAVRVPVERKENDQGAGYESFTRSTRLGC